MDEAVESFQRCNVNHCGAPLKCDGVLGPQTAWARALATLCLPRRRLIAFAQVHYGLKETAPNDDPAGLIRGWIERAGCKPGAPWCAAWASWVLSEVLGKSLRVGGALRLARLFPVVTSPIAGDVFAYPTDAKGHGHIGFVSGSDALEVMTLEGNCANQLASWRRSRSQPGIKFYRPIDDISGTPPGVVPTVPLAPWSASTR